MEANDFTILLSPLDILGPSDNIFNVNRTDLLFNYSTIEQKEEYLKVLNEQLRVAEFKQRASPDGRPIYIKKVQMHIKELRRLIKQTEQEIFQLELKL